MSYYLETFYLAVRFVCEGLNHVIWQIQHEYSIKCDTVNIKWFEYRPKRLRKSTEIVKVKRCFYFKMNSWSWMEIDTKWTQISRHSKSSQDHLLLDSISAIIFHYCSFSSFESRYSVSDGTFSLTLLTDIKQRIRWKVTENLSFS